MLCLWISHWPWKSGVKMSKEKWTKRSWWEKRRHCSKQHYKMTGEMQGRGLGLREAHLASKVPWMSPRPGEDEARLELYLFPARLLCLSHTKTRILLTHLYTSMQPSLRISQFIRTSGWECKASRRFCIYAYQLKNILQILGQLHYFQPAFHSVHASCEGKLWCAV